MSDQTKTKLGFAPNKQAAAARCELTYGIVDAAQKAGCAAFRANGNVQCDELLDWIAENGTDDQESPDYHVERAKKTRAERMIKELALEEARKKLIAEESIRTVITRHVSVAKSRFLLLGASIAPRAQLKLGLTKEQADWLQEQIENECKAVAETLASTQWSDAQEPEPIKKPAAKKRRVAPKRKAKAKAKTKAKPKRKAAKGSKA